MHRSNLPCCSGLLIILLFSLAPAFSCLMNIDPARALERNLAQIASLERQLLAEPNQLDLMLNMAQAQREAGTNAALIEQQDLLDDWVPADHIRPFEAGLETAAPWVEQLVEVHPEAPEAWHVWARHQRASERTDALASAAERLPGQHSVHIELLAALVESGDMDGAIALQRGWIKSDWPAPEVNQWHPTQEEAVVLLAELLVHYERSNEAVEELDAALSSASSERVPELLQAFESLDLNSPLADLARAQEPPREPSMSEKVRELVEDGRQREAAVLTEAWVQDLSADSYLSWPQALKTLLGQHELTDSLANALQLAAESVLDLSEEQMLSACEYPLPARSVVLACVESIRSSGSNVTERFQSMMRRLDRHPRLVDLLLGQTDGALSISLAASAAAGNPRLCERAVDSLSAWQPSLEETWKASKILENCSSLPEKDRIHLLQSSLLASCDQTEVFAHYAESETWFASRIVHELERCLAADIFTGQRWHLLEYLSPDARLAQQLKWLELGQLPPAEFAVLLQLLLATGHSLAADAAETMLAKEDPEWVLHALAELAPEEALWMQTLDRLRELASTPRELALVDRWWASHIAKNGDVEGALSLYESFLKQAAYFEDVPKATGEYLQLVVETGQLGSLAGVLEELEQGWLQQRITSFARFEDSRVQAQRKARESLGLELPIEDRIARIFKRSAIPIPEALTDSVGQAP